MIEEVQRNPDGERHKGGRPRLSSEEKLRRGTFRYGYEMKRLQAAARAGQGPEEAPKPLKFVPARSYAAVLACYVDGVLNGSIVAGTYVRQACARQAADMAREDWGYVWSQAEANRACHFLEQLPHVEGRQWATPLIVLEPWQVFVVSLLFGWRLRADPSRRRFTTLYLEVARKAAKSTLMAGVALYHLLCEGEVGGSVICGATTGSQARMVFGIMQKMARRSLYLASQGVQAFANSILTPAGECRTVNSKASSLDGLNPSMIILDESHAQDFELHDVLVSAQGARANPLLVCPTTAGYDLLSVGYALHQQVEKVLGGVFEADHVLGVIYTLDAGDDWRDERVWIKANPMIGVTPSWDYMRRYALDAQQVPGKQGEFRVKACCQWMQSASRWIDPDAWARCTDTTLRLEDFDGQKCWVGGDLASVDDLAAVALVFERGDELVVFATAYLPAGVIEERSRRVPQYRIWAEDGELTATVGTMIDYDRIEGDVRDACRRFAVQAAVFDEWGSTQLVGRLANDGIPARVEAKRAKNVTPAAKDFEARVTHGKVRHNGGSLLTWAVLNAAVTRRVDDSLLPKKDGAESANKIDPLDAILQAMAARLSAQKPPPRHQLLILGGARRT